MFDWSCGLPVILPMAAPTTVTIPSNQYRTFRSFKLPPTLYAYEVRILHPKDRDVVVNVFGLSDMAYDPQGGNNAMQHALAVVKLK